MQVEHSSQSLYHNRSLSNTPVRTFINTPTKSRHVRFYDVGTKSTRSSATSVRRYLDYSHKSSLPRTNGYVSPGKSSTRSVSQNSDKNGEMRHFESSTSDNYVKRSSTNKSEANTPRYKFHSGGHTPDSSLLLGSKKDVSKPKTRNDNFSFAAKSSIDADEVDDTDSFSKRSVSVKDNSKTPTKHTYGKSEFTTILQQDQKEDRSLRTSPKNKQEDRVIYQKKEEANKRIAEIVAPESPKKADTVKLPPTKQNGHLVHANEPGQTSKGKKAEDRDGRQLADPKKKKKTEEESNRQAKSAPSKRKDDVKDPPISPQVDNYTHRTESDSPTNGKKKATKDQNEKNRKTPAPEAKENKAKNGAVPNYARGNENDRRENENPNRASKGPSEKNRNSQQTNKTRSEDERHKESPTNSSPNHDKSRPVTKGTRQDRNHVSNLDDQYFSPEPNSEEALLREEKREQQIMKLRLPKKNRYGPVRAKGLQTPRTPRTPRSRTPRSRTPRNRYYRKPGYSHSDTGDYRSPRRKSILNNKEAVILERSRPNSYKWENKPIYRHETKDWEDQRDELTWRPSVNSPTDWLRVYVGDIQIREKSAKSRKNSPESTERTVRPGAPQRNSNEYILTKRQVPVYKNMQSVYNNKLKRDKETREKRFFQKLQECQSLKARMQISDLVDRQRKREITKQRQQEQLKELRQRFEDAAWVRFNTQYVTSRILEHEKMNRYAYGLPEEVDGAPEFESKLKRKPPKIKVDFGKLDKANKKKYSSMFSIYKGPEWDPISKTPPMEGIDTVDIDYETDGELDDHEGVENGGGHKKVKTRRVKDVIREAEKEMADLKAKDSKTGVTPRLSETETNNKTSGDIDLDSDDDDDDMSDIFERARKKYNLEVDDETMSRSRR
ncbi:serine/arginine repetitive matrix protein 2-like isoform X1 [Saccostrea echinata]|uniref:serine/arginine repetitive matrix protein 2-like isoform X1 n=1 Tax=Saccostrea echinata TaxID=191078 RepID=UPI002A7EFB71|nr:serine/arginine repetitive matrix protein 2-like isoform X1 [Saccostrea echinata]